MYKKIDWDVAQDYSSERELEVAWIRRKLKGITKNRIADFGCVNYGFRRGACRWIGHDAYELDASNETLGFDKAEIPELRGQYVIADLMRPDIYKAASIDYGICVSVMEHVGINCEPRILAGDFIALKNMYDLIRPGGKLFITVPASYVASRPSPNIRVYSPEILSVYCAALFASICEVEYYRYVPPFWMRAHENKLKHQSLRDSLEELARVEVLPEKRRGVACLACITIEKGV